MCRLYGMRATHPTRIDCELVESQNALIRQARRDERGVTNADGWGIGLVLPSGDVRCERQARPAFESGEYRAEAIGVSAIAAIAHVRAASVGGGSLANTHPFRHGDEILAHNGHVPRFDMVRRLLLERLDTGHRETIAGDTDSEHLFALLRMRAARHPDTDRRETLRALVDEVGELVTEAGAPMERLHLNLLWSVGAELAGTRLRNSLWCIERDEPLECEVCGHRHAHPPEDEAYRMVVLASERITDEEWSEVPDGSVFAVDSDVRLALDAL